MRKGILALAFLFTIAVVFTGCRDKKTPEEKIENAIDELNDEAEEVSDDVKDAIDDVKEEIEEAKEEAE